LRSSFQIPTNGDYSLVTQFTGRYFNMQNVVYMLAQEGLITTLASRT
jgi:hypothetical protein